MTRHAARRSALAIAVVFAVLVALLPGTPAAAVDPVGVDSVSPQVVAVGATVTVTGYGFSATPTQNVVRINGVAATVATATAGQLTVTVPTGATSGPVTVQSPTGSATSPADLYLPPPTFTVANVASTQRLAYGTDATAAVSTSGQIALLTVAGQTGHKLSLRLTTSTFGSSTSNARVAVYRPDGTALVSPTGFATAGIFVEPQALTADGSYQVLIDPQGTAVGQVVVTAYDVPVDAPFAATPGGGAVIATTAVPGQSAVISLPGTAGARASFSFSAGTFGSSSNARVTVRKPDGTTLIAVTNCGVSCWLDATVLPTTGTYSVLVDPQGALVGSLTAQIYDVPSDATVPLTIGGPLQTVTTSTPGQNGTFTFPGTVGDRVYFTFSAGTFASSSSATVAVRQPDGTTLVSALYCGVSCAVDVKTLPVTGTYTIFVDPQGAVTGSLTARLTTVATDTAVTVTIGGVSAPVSVATAGQNATVSFTGALNQRVFFAFSGGTFGSSSSATVLVRRPDGTTFVSAIYCGVSCLIDTKVLPVAGTYTILLDPQGAATGTLTVQLYDVPADTAVTLVPGDPAQTVATTTPGQNAIVSFNGAVGQRVFFAFSAGTFGSSSNATVLVRRPDGTTFVSAIYCGVSCLIDTKVLPVAGTYTIFLDPQSAVTGALTVRVFDVPTDPTATVTVGGPAETVTTTVPGQDATATFTAAVGQRLSLQVTGTFGTSTSSASVSVLKPDGTVLFAATGLGSNTILFGPTTIATAGVYTVTIGPASGLTGSAAVRVFDISDASVPATVGGPPVTVTTTTPGQSGSVTFPGVTGQRVAVRITGSTYGSSTANLSASVLRPDGTVFVAAAGVGSSGLFIDTKILPADGTYTVLLDPQASLTGSVQVEIIAVPADVALALPLDGTTTVVTVAVPGQNAVASFTGTAGQRVSLRFTNGTSGFYGTVRNPDGTDLKVRWSIGTSDYIDPLTLPADGVYTLLFDPTGATVGSVEARAWLVPADATATATPGGAAVTVTTAVPGQNAVVTVPATAGHRLSLRFTGATSAYLTIRKPDGTDLKARWYASTSDFVEPLTLPVDGNYALLLDPSTYGVGALTVQVWDVPADAVTVAALDGPAVVAQVTTPGQNAAVPFEGVAGHRLSLSLSGGTTGMYAVIRKPDGTDLKARWYAGTSNFTEPLVMPVDGTYTLLLDPSTFSIGVMTVRAYDVPADPTATVAMDGVQVTTNIVVPGQNATVTFPGTAARRAYVILDSVGFTGSVAVSLRNPAGTSLTSVTLYGTPDTGYLGPINLPSTGAYTLFVNPATSGTGVMKMRVYDATSPAPVVATANGQPSTVSNNVPGQTADVTFTGTAGQRVSVVPSGDYQDGDTYYSYMVSLIAPSGTTVGYGSQITTAEWLLGGLTLPTSGTYTIRVDPSGVGVGTTTLRIYDITAEVAISTSPGAGVVAMDLPAPGMTAVLSFPATAGQQISLAMVDGPYATFSAAMLDPSGTTVCSFSTIYEFSLLQCAATVAGTYTFRLTGREPVTGTWHLELIDTLGTATATIENELGPNGWISDTELYGYLEVQSLTPIAGYSLVLDSSPTTVPDPTVNQEDEYFLLPLAEGVQYLHVRAVATNGVAGPTRHYPIKVDHTAPAAPTVTVPTHPDPDVAVPSLTVVAQFAGGSDASGISGYAASVSHGPDDLPQGPTVPGASYTTTLSGEGEWFLHVITVDGAGNRSQPTHRRLAVDTAPSAPLIESVTHPTAGTAYPSQDFVATWAGTRTAWAATWATALDHNPGTVPDTVTASTETRFGAHLAAGTWWLHVRGVDASGNPGATGHFQVVVAPPATRFLAPLAGRTVWGTTPLTLACAGALTVQAQRADGTWAAIATTDYASGICSATWATTASWPDGTYPLRALDGATVVASGLTVTVKNAADVYARLAADYEAGVITASEYVWYALYAAMAPAQLPLAYVDAPGTGQPELAMRVYTSLFKSLPAQVRADITAWLTPTEEPPVAGRGSSSLASGDCSGWWHVVQGRFDCRATTEHFTVIYDSDHVGPTASGAPRATWVQTMMDALEQAWHVYHDTMTYKVPDHLDVVLNPLMPNGSGVSIPGTAMQMSSGWQTVTPYLARHELFHYVQYEYMTDAYFANSWMNWWMEATAEWAAHRVEFWTNDSYGRYYSSLDDFLAESDERFDESNSVVKGGGPEYGAFIVAEYLEQRLDPEAIKQTWQRLGGLFPAAPGDVILDLLKERRIEHDVAGELEKFRQWAYVLDANGTQVGFTDSDAGTWARDYDAPHETVTVSTTGSGFQLTQGDFEIQQSGAHYIAIDNPALIGVDLGMAFTADDDDVRGSVLLLNAAGLPATACGLPLPVDRDYGQQVRLSAACPRAVFIIVNAENPGEWGTWEDVSYTVSYTRTSIVLTNGTVDIGVGRYGNLDDPGGVGLRLHNQPDTESVLYACWCEGWGVGVPGGVGGSVTAEFGAKNLSVEDFTVIGNLATSRVSGPGGLEVIHTVYPSADPNLFTMQVIVANHGTTALTPVRYRRVIDWDLNQLTGYETVQQRSGDSSFISGVTNDGYADPDPAYPMTDYGVNGWFTDNGPGDDGVLIEVDLGTIGAGSSKMFTIYYGVATSEAAALSSVDAVGAQMYSFGQINPDGSPFTAIMAIDGGTLTAPPIGPHALVAPADRGRASTRELAPSVRNTGTAGDPR